MYQEIKQLSFQKLYKEFIIVKLVKIPNIMYFIDNILICIYI